MLISHFIPGAEEKGTYVLSSENKSLRSIRQNKTKQQQKQGPKRHVLLSQGRRGEEEKGDRVFTSMREELPQEFFVLFLQLPQESGMKPKEKVLKSNKRKHQNMESNKQTTESKSIHDSCMSPLWPQFTSVGEGAPQ